MLRLKPFRQGPRQGSMRDHVNEDLSRVKGRPLDLPEQIKGAMRWDISSFLDDMALMNSKRSEGGYLVFIYPQLSFIEG